MARFSAICVLGGSLAALTVLAESACAGNLTIQTPKITVHQPAPLKLNDSSIIQYRNGGAGSDTPRKLPARTGFGSVTLNRGVTSDQSLQQWQQSVKSEVPATNQSVGGVILRDEQNSGQPGWHIVGKPHHPKHD